MSNCKLCIDKHYIISKRDDNFLCVERCDECSMDTHTDFDAAQLAEADEIGVSFEPPYYLTEQTNPDDWEQKHQNYRELTT